MTDQDKRGWIISLIFLYSPVQLLPLVDYHVIPLCSGLWFQRLAALLYLRLRLLLSTKVTIFFVLALPAFESILGCKISTWIPSLQTALPEVNYKLSQVGGGGL